jgi:ABC-type nitrate/sulfonate/bicarbonate transport system permease component
MSNFFNPHAPLSGLQREQYGIGALFVLITAWAAITVMGWVDANKLPSPFQVFNAFTYLAWNNGHSILLGAMGASLTRIGVAALAVCSVGIPVGILLGASPRLNSIFSPIIDPFRSAPIAALLPIFVMWFGIGDGMKIAFLFTAAVVYIIPMVRDAMLGVSYCYWEATTDLSATPVEVILKGVLPIAMPRIFDAVIVSTSILWTYITVAEYVNADSGLGQMIQNAKRFSAMDQVFAGIIVIIGLALFTNVTLTYLKKRIYFWEGTQ